MNSSVTDTDPTVPRDKHISHHFRTNEDIRVLHMFLVYQILIDPQRCIALSTKPSTK